MLDGRTLMRVTSGVYGCFGIYKIVGGASKMNMHCFLYKFSDKGQESVGVFLTLPP